MVEAPHAVDAAHPLIRVDVVCSATARETRQEVLHLPAGSMLRQALQQSRIGQLPLVADWLQGRSAPDALACSVWNRKVSLDHPLRADDRIELCRPLQVDPKVARRERFARQGAKTAGLFARRRAGGKPGY